MMTVHQKRERKVGNLKDVYLLGSYLILDGPTSLSVYISSSLPLPIILFRLPSFVFLSSWFSNLSLITNSCFPSFLYAISPTLLLFLFSFSSSTLICFLSSYHSPIVITFNPTSSLSVPLIIISIFYFLHIPSSIPLSWSTCPYSFSFLFVLSVLPFPPFLLMI